MNSTTEITIIPLSYQAGLDELEAISQELKNLTPLSPDILLQKTERGQFLAQWLDAIITTAQEKLNQLLTPELKTEPTQTAL